jgi:protein required for attachment to host cells
MKLANGTILMVADGSKMLLLRNEGDAKYPDLRVIEHRSFENPPNRDLMSDGPGVSHSSIGPGRSAYEQADPHQENEDHFAAESVKTLIQVAKKIDADLVVVAPPDTLGIMRRHYDRTVKEHLIAEIDKNLTKHPIEEITRLIVAHHPRLLSSQFPAPTD